MTPMNETTAPSKLKNHHQTAGSRNRSREWLPYLWMMLPGLTFIVLFQYGPLFGSIIAFQKFNPGKGLLGSPWVGFENFAFMFRLQSSWEILRNTLLIAVAKLSLGLLASLIFGLLLNEVRWPLLKRGVQTLVYLPNFISWVILASPKKLISNMLRTAASSLSSMAPK